MNSDDDQGDCYVLYPLALEGCESLTSSTPYSDYSTEAVAAAGEESSTRLFHCNLSLDTIHAMLIIFLPCLA